MSRNTNSHFSYAPSVSVPRSSFDRPSTHKTTFAKAGRLYPIFIDEVLPGDTHSLRTSLVARTSTPIFPVMDNLFMDIYYFFVPNRLVWSHWKELMGENTESAWIPTTSYQVPQINLNGVQIQSVADHFGIRPNNSTSSTPISVSALPFRAFALIWNEWFRPEAVFSPIPIPMDERTQSYGTYSESTATATTYLTSTVNGGICPPVRKFGDYFTSCLPSPQKGEAVTLPLGKYAPVYTGAANVPGTPSSNFLGSSEMNLKPNVASSSVISGTHVLYSVNGAMEYASANSGVTSGGYAVPSNLYADLGNATAATINDLRLAFAVQSLLETDARSGSRYTEIVFSHFHTKSPDARQQRPEYLGGKRVRLNMQQVLQTSSTDSTSPQGNVSGYSLTSDSFGSYNYSATEHGYIIGCCCFRTSQTYQYGIERHWFRKDRLDYYWPALAHTGEQEVKNRELYYNATQPADSLVPDTSNDNDSIFGYQEYAAEYRYKNSLISGSFRSNSSNPGSDGWQSLDSWHYADKWNSKPTLSPEFISQSNEPVARTLAVDGEDEFIADFYFDLKSTRCMPTYSIPGLLNTY